jgi:ferrochelatase
VRRSILLVNLGTPENSDPRSVGIYLKQFLMDPLVIDIPYLWRWFLVHFLIVPFRKYKSSEAYKKVWSKRGSPLFYNTRDLTESLKKIAGSEFHIEMAMRYGSPSIDQGIEKCIEEGSEEILFVPLYPQSTFSSTVSSIENLVATYSKLKTKVRIRVLPNFYGEKDLLKIYAKTAYEIWEREKCDFALMSFHGLPERHIEKTNSLSDCLNDPNCCNRITEKNKNCYRAQCFWTAREIAKLIGLSTAEYKTSFQSRLGRTPWIKPYTDLILDEILAIGKKRLMVVCPSFVADCLETLEEVEMRLRFDFKAKGGEELFLVPAPNGSIEFAQFINRWIERAKSTDIETFQSMNPEQILNQVSVLP